MNIPENEPVIFTVPCKDGQKPFGKGAPMKPLTDFDSWKFLAYTAVAEVTSYLGRELQSQEFDRVMYALWKSRRIMVKDGKLYIEK